MAISLDLTVRPDGRGWQADVGTAFEQHHRRIVGTLVHRVRDTDLAEDLAAEAFARLAQAAAAGWAPDDPAAWLHRVAENLVVDDARHARVVRLAAPRLVDRALPDDPEESAILRDEAARVRHAVGALPAEQQTALLLAASGWSSGEIGRRLGRTPVGVRTILFRARRRIREELREPGPAVGFDLAPQAG